ncbi:MAG: ABC transporter permease [Anaerolineales bacterium]
MNPHSNAFERISIIFEKELKDNLRDRRSVFSALMSALIGPVLLVMLIIIMGRTFNTDNLEKPLELPVQGAENAPSLISFLEQNNVLILPAPENPRQDVRNGVRDLVLIIPDDFGESFSAGQPARVELVVDSSRQSAMPAVERARMLLDQYSAQIGSLRLIARGVSPAVLQPMIVARVDVSTPQSQVGIFLNMMPYFIVLVVFVGGMYVVIDTTAGERERGSLEPLLINPAPRWEVVVGKLAASIPFAVFAVFLTLVAFAIGFNVVPIEDYVGFQVSIDINVMIGIFLISLPMILLASALQMIIATFTRSFKEAQTYVAFLPLIPALPGIALAFIPVRASFLNMAIPTFGQQLLINQLMRGEPIDPANVVVSVISTTLCSILLVYLAVQLFKRERILMGAK